MASASVTSPETGVALSLMRNAIARLLITGARNACRLRVPGNSVSVTSYINGHAVRRMSA